MEILLFRDRLNEKRTALALCMQLQTLVVQFFFFLSCYETAQFSELYEFVVEC